MEQNNTLDFGHPHRRGGPEPVCHKHTHFSQQTGPIARRPPGQTFPPFFFRTCLGSFAAEWQQCNVDTLPCKLTQALQQWDNVHKTPKHHQCLKTNHLIVGTPTISPLLRPRFLSWTYGLLSTSGHYTIPKVRSKSFFSLSRCQLN